MNMKNKTFAMPAALAAIPPKPKIAAIMAMMKKMTVQRNIIVSLECEELKECSYFYPSIKKTIPIDPRFLHIPSKMPYELLALDF